MFFKKQVSGVVFTREEFDIMIQEVLYQKPESYDMLCVITKKSVFSTIRDACYKIRCLRFRDLAEDILDDVYVKVMSNAVDGFLRKDGLDAPIQDDPEKFSGWVRTIARNTIIDYINTYSREDRRTAPLEDELGPVGGWDPEKTEERQAHREQLEKAMRIVLDSDIGIYKVLTWLAMYTFMLVFDLTKIESNDQIIAAFEEKTLNEMYDTIRAAARWIPWLQVLEAYDEKIRAALQESFCEKQTYGETVYRDLFMKQNGVPSGKKSISDWENRIHTSIRKKQMEPPEQKPQMKRKPKRCPEESKADAKRSPKDMTGSSQLKTRREE
jgi:hypothetical protein